jgi:hypothetical protein
MELVKLGKFKVAFYDPKHPIAFDSVMFDTLQEASAFGKAAMEKGHKYVIMENTKVGDGMYRWNILPYGQYYAYRIGNFFLYHWWIPLAGILLVASRKVYRAA